MYLMSLFLPAVFLNLFVNLAYIWDTILYSLPGQFDWTEGKQMRNISANLHVKWSNFTLPLLSQEETGTWLYSHWTFVIREIETWWNIATRSMSLVFKINILALTWHLFSINAWSSIWHFSNSGRLLSCDNMQFHWHYLLITCDSAPNNVCSSF